ncbi:MAG: hypothetical protein QOI64_1434 [Solirubrobacteraceae bacterium]|jgi:hypothetical protein|nr:hypothetical protein [Solirubrobacteraceae bacterium]
MIWNKPQSKVTRPRGVQPRQKVTLRMAGLRSVEARVEEVGDTYAILGLFRAPEKPLAGIGAVSATLDTMGRRGPVEVAATVRQHNDEPDAVRVDFSRNPKIKQRRESFRMDAMTDVVLSLRSGAQVKTHSLDLSASGLLLAGPSDLRMDERVWLAIDVGESPPVRARGRVIRVTAEGHSGVRFDQIDDRARERLIRYLFERQRLSAWIKNR